MKVALITGAGSGIGRETALEFARKGFNLVLSGPDLNDLKKVGEISGVEYIAAKVDVRSSKEVRSLIKKAAKKFDRIDVLINNAGIRHTAKVADLSESAWDLVLETNLKGVFLCSKEVLPIMLKQKRGVIMNVSSVNGLKGLPTASAYCASKAGIIGFTQALSSEVRQDGIKVLAVCPAATSTKNQIKAFPQQKKVLMMPPKYVAKKIFRLCKSRTVKTGSSIILSKPLWMFLSVLNPWGQNKR